MVELRSLGAGWNRHEVGLSPLSALVGEAELNIQKRSRKRTMLQKRNLFWDTGSLLLLKIDLSKNWIILAYKRGNIKLWGRYQNPA